MTQTETDRPTTKLDEPAVRDAKSPVEEAATPDLKTIDPKAPLPRLRTTLSPDEMQQRLESANYRGRLPEIEWLEPRRAFKFDILGNRLEHDVFGTISDSPDAEGRRDIQFEVRLKRLPVWIIIIVVIVSTPIGAYFMDMVPLLNRIPHPWIWFPIVNIGLSFWWLIAEVKKTIPRAWWEAKRYIAEKVAPEVDARVVE